MSYNPQNPNGQATSANSSPVVIASDQSAVPISAASLPLPSSAATSTKQSDGSQKTQVVDGSGNVIGATSNALDVNIKSGNPTTIAVTQSTATNLKAQAEAYQGGTAVGSGNPLQVTLANTGTNSTAVKVDGSAVTQPISAASLPTHAVTQSGTWTVQPGNTANTTPWLFNSVATSGGLTTYHLVSAASTNATVVKASAGQLYGWMISNTTSSYSYVAFHNTTSTPTAGASIFFKIGIPANGGANVEFTNGITFSTGIAITTVTGTADSNNTAVAANDLVINLFYK